ncbi:response regulator [Roseateles sp. 22389]|uniref:response regulator n=1 Tax=Roseateles sp. 22389 TaxID=3453916 RepID=UPI003F861002
MVDDLPEMSTSLGSLLAGLGFSVRTALSGEDALCLIEDCPPDAVISDIEMPGIGGIGLARAIRGSMSKHALLIGISGSAQSLREAAELFDHTLLKPVSIEALEELLAFDS